MKTETLLLIAGAVGVGYYLHKKKVAEVAATAATTAATIASATPRVATIDQVDLLTEPDAVVVNIPDVQYVPVPAWGPSWGSYRGRGGGWGGGHRGGHHGRGGMHGFHGRRR